MIPQAELDKIKGRYEMMKPYLQNEQQRRMYALSEVRALNQYGAVSAISRIMDISRTTITKGLKEAAGGEVTPERIRKSGGGRKRLEEIDGTLQSDLLKLMDDSTCGDPCNPLKWTCRSLHNIEEALQKMGHQVSHMKIHQMLMEQGYSMQGNQKALEGNSKHPDRNEQFEIINQKAKTFMEMDAPVISVDTKKKELIGTDKDTAEFAVESIRRWWQQMGKLQYPNANKLMVTCDGGGSNASRSRLWKYELQRFATEENLEIHVSHYPPGTSKWNKIEHSMFSYISKNWRGRPLISHEVVVNLIASTKNKKGLAITCVLDRNKYQTGRKITDEEMEALNVEPNDRLPAWNYCLMPVRSCSV